MGNYYWRCVLRPHNFLFIYSMTNLSPTELPRKCAEQCLDTSQDYEYLGKNVHVVKNINHTRVLETRKLLKLSTKKTYA